MSNVSTMRIINCDLRPTEEFLDVVGKHSKGVIGVVERAINRNVAVLQGNSTMLRIVGEDIANSAPYGTYRAEMD